MVYNDDESRQILICMRIWHIIIYNIRTRVARESERDIRRAP